MANGSETRIVLIPTRWYDFSLSGYFYHSFDMQRGEPGDAVKLTFDELDGANRVRSLLEDAVAWQEGIDEDLPVPDAADYRALPRRFDPDAWLVDEEPDPEWECDVHLEGSVSGHCGPDTLRRYADAMRKLVPCIPPAKLAPWERVQEVFAALAGANLGLYVVTDE